MYHQDQIPLPHPGQTSGAEAVLPVSADMPPELVTGKALKQARRQRGLSQIDLAEYMSVSQSRVSAWENGYDEIPYQHRLRLIDLLSNRRGLFDPYIEHLVRTDPNLVINGAPDFKHLHVGSALKPKFYEPDLDPSTWSPHDRPHAGMRHVEFVHLARTAGREISSQLLEMTAERDVPTLNKGALRMRSHQVALQFQDYPKLILSRYDFVKPALGENRSSMVSCFWKIWTASRRILRAVWNRLRWLEKIPCNRVPNPCIPGGGEVAEWSKARPC